MRILGVDPGSRITGWGLIESRGPRATLLDCGVLRLGPSTDPLADRLGVLHEQFTALLLRLRPDGAAVESPFHGASARSALQLAHARGVILAVLAVGRVEITEHAPASVKQSVTGNGRASKDQVRAMVGQLLGAQDLGASRDLSDALAVALCHTATEGYRSAMRRAGVADPVALRGMRR